MRRGAAPLLGLLLCAAGVRAQEVVPPTVAAPPRLTVSLPDTTPGGVPVVRAAGLMADGLFDQALHDGFPVRFQFHLELWRDATLFDRLEDEATWMALLHLDPLSGIYTLTRSGGTEEQHASVAAIGRALGTPFAVDLVPRHGGDRYYYVVSLVMESLSLSEFDEVERWLRGDLGRAITREGDVGNALSRGARRLLIRLSGLPRRRIEVRSPTFRSQAPAQLP